MEKASIDEVYIDVTSMVEAELRLSGGGDAPGERGAAAAGPSGDDGAHAGGTAGFGWGGIVVDGPLRTDSEFERRLSVGAMIACRLRGAVHEQLGEGIVVNECSGTLLDPGWRRAWLSVGALIACRLRGAVCEQLGELAAIWCLQLRLRRRLSVIVRSQPPAADWHLCRFAAH